MGNSSSEQDSAEKVVVDARQLRGWFFDSRIPFVAAPNTMVKENQAGVGPETALAIGLALFKLTSAPEPASSSWLQNGRFLGVSRDPR